MRDRNDGNLTRRYPKRPIRGKVFYKNSKHAFNGSQDRPMNNNWSLLNLINNLRSLGSSLFILIGSSTIFKTKSNGKLIIKLDCCTLMFFTMCILNGNINLGAIESTITRI